jgi:hypothetical protein
MSLDIRHQQRWLVTVVVLLVILLILVVLGLMRSIPGRSSDPGPQIGHRSPAVKLAYCNPEVTRLCVVSFGQIEGGDMLVNFQLPSLIYPPFTLVINRYGVESAYKCTRTRGFLGGMTCSGASQTPGEILQFKVIAQKDGRLIAEGKFLIIGIAISTPEDPSTETPTASPTESPADLTPFPTEAFPTPEISTPGSPTLSPPTSYPDYP